MTDLPHVFVGQPPTEEHIRIMEAYLRNHDDVPAASRVMTAANLNRAIDWWNGLQASPAAGLYCLDSECDCRNRGGAEGGHEV